MRPFLATEVVQGRSCDALLGHSYWWGKLRDGEEAPVVVGGGTSLRNPKMKER